MPTRQACKLCGAKIKFYITKKQKSIPVDDTKIVTIINSDGVIHKGFIPHWATCPKKKEFSKIRKG